MIRRRPSRRPGWAPLTVAGALAMALLAGSAAAGPEQQLYDAIANDPSFKVRMQAIRVLTKRLLAQKRPATKEALQALERSATGDESHLVRGLGCFSIGQLGDVRLRPALERARADGNPFVREQAEQALRQLPTTAPEPGMAVSALPLPDREGAAGNGRPGDPLVPRGRRALILSVEQSAEPLIARDLLDRLKGSLEERVRSLAPPGFEVGSRSENRGFHLAGSVADRRVESSGGGKVRISMVVRVTISTWPENHLRHVVTARATAETASSSEAGRTRLEQRVLEAAVKQAVDEALAEVSRE